MSARRVAPFSPARRHLAGFVSILAIVGGCSNAANPDAVLEPTDGGTHAPDYFPLNVGDRWFYSRNQHEPRVVEVTNTVLIDAVRYHVVTTRTVRKPAAETQFLRKSAAGDVIELKGGKEYPLWNVTARPGETWYWDSFLLGILTSRDTTFRTTAAAFDSCLAITVHDPWGDGPFVYALAPGIGVVGRNARTDRLALDSAFIDGVWYP